MMMISVLSASIEQSVMYNQLGVVSGMQRYAETTCLYCAVYSIEQEGLAAEQSYLPIGEPNSFHHTCAYRAMFD